MSSLIPSSSDQLIRTNDLHQLHIPVDNNTNDGITYATWRHRYVVTLKSSAFAMSAILCGVSTFGFAISSAYTTSQYNTVNNNYYETMLLMASFGSIVGAFFGTGMGAIFYPLATVKPTK